MTKGLRFFLKLFLHENALWIHIPLICSVCISFTNAQDQKDFVFVAEIPTYVPFQPLPIDTLLDHEQRYLGGQKKWQTNCQDAEYHIEETTKGTPWRGKFCPYEKNVKVTDTSTPVLNLEADISRLQLLATLFRNESFGNTAGESQNIFDSSMRLVLLANRMKSVFHVKNQSIKYIQNTFDFSSAILILRGTWEPKWVKKGAGSVSLKEVRNYMRYCLTKARDGAESPENREKWKEKLIKLIEEEKKGGGHVPYHDLREYLRTAGTRSDFIKAFMTQNPHAVLYEATHDSDLVGLRILSDKRTEQEILPGATGLYTHYLDVLRSGKIGDYPTVLTTGYRAVYEPKRFKTVTHFAWIYQAIEEDRYARASLAVIDFRLPYIAEPNCLYRVPQGQLAIAQSFLILPNGNNIIFGALNQYDPCESMAIMRQIYKSNPKVRVHFDPGHPVLMSVPQRMLVNKKSKTAFNFNDYGSYDEMKETWDIKSLARISTFSAQISQSLFAYRDYAMTLYRQLDLIGGLYSCVNDSTKKKQKINRADALFKSLIATLFNHIIDSKGLKISYDNPSVENAHLIKRLDGIRKLDTPEEQLKSLTKLLNEIYGPSIGDILFKAAQAIKTVRTDHRKAFFERDPLYSPLRTSPTQSTQSKVVPLVVIKKEETKTTAPHNLQISSSVTFTGSKVIKREVGPSSKPVFLGYRKKIQKLLLTRTQKDLAAILDKYCKTHIISQPRISEFIRGKANSALELAIDAYESANGIIV